MRRSSLVVMLKEPRPGRVKTRLGADIGMVPAAWWVRHQTARLLRRMTDPRWQLILAVSPDNSARQGRAWPAHLPRIAQGRGDLGARMARIMRRLPPGSACIIGGDIPGITPAHVARAFAALGDHDAVFGPAPDGGYWLTGLKRSSALPPTLYRDVRWSTPHALADSMAGLRPRRIALIDTLQDVDSAGDLAASSCGKYPGGR